MALPEEPQTPPVGEVAQVGPPEPPQPRRQLRVFDPAQFPRINPHTGYQATPEGQRKFGIWSDSLRKQRYVEPIEYEESAQQVPNYDKLRPYEQAIFKALPGLAASPVGKALQWFGESWRGKALSFIDMGAEFVERGTGLIAQAGEAAGDPEKWRDFRTHLAEAWHAGSLAADFSNIPTYKWGSDGETQGWSWPTDLPGIAGIVDARKRLAAGESLEQVREDYYNNLGALALRSQLQDTFFHIFGDPLNVVLPMIKPVDRLALARRAVLAQKVTPEAISALRTTQQILEQAGDVENAAKVAARIAGVEGDLLTRTDRLILAVTGGVEIKTAEDLTKVERFFRSKWNPFSLTPEARAQETLTVLDDHMKAYFFGRGLEPEEIVEGIYRAAQGAAGPEFGHAFITPEGRVIQGFVNAASASADDLRAAWIISRNERLLLETLADELGEHPARLLRAILDDEPAILQRIGQEAADQLKVLEGVPINKMEFETALMNKLTDSAAQVMVGAYGLKARGLIMRTAQAMKAVETLAFLRLNPGFVMRNFWNNEITMIARGVGGGIFKDVLRVWDDVGFQPRRLRQAFTMVGDVTIGGKKLASGERHLAKALLGDPKGIARFLDSIAEKASNVKLPGIIDMGKVASWMEESASVRSMTLGYLDAWKYWKPGKWFDKVDDALPPEIVAQISQADPNILETLARSLADARKPEDIDRILRSNFNLSFQSILDNATTRMGENIDDVLPAEFLERIRTGLIEAAQNNRIPRYMTQERDNLRTFIRDLTTQRLTITAEDVANGVQLSGPSYIGRSWGDIMDYHWGSMAAHSQNMAQLGDYIRLLPTDQARRFWERMFRDSDEFFGSVQDTVAASMRGIRNGAQRAGFDVPEEMVTRMDDWAKGWREFYATRKRLLDKYWDTPAGKRPPWDEIQTQLDERFARMVDLEDEVMASVDDGLAQMLVADNPDIAGTFRAWRQAATDMRRADKQAVIDLRTRIADLSPRQRAEAWQEFWNQRIQGITDIWRNERQGLNMMAGDEMAKRYYQELADSSGFVNITGPAGEPGIGVPRLEDFDVQVPRSQMPPEVSDAFKGEASSLLDELEQATGPVPVEGVRLTDNPPWYQDLYNQGFTNKKTVENALKRIIEDQAADDVDFKYVQKIREVIRQRLIEQPGLPEEMGAVLRGEVPIERLNEILATEDIFETGGRVFLPDLDSLVQHGMPPADRIIQEFWYTRGFSALDELELAALDQARRPPLTIANVPEELHPHINAYLDTVKGQMADARFAATRFAEFKRDSALLNYNRRLNFDTWATTIFPFQFWFTHSFAKWMIHSVDRPAMLTTFARMQKLFETAGSPQSGFPQRLKRHIRIPLPFLPEWMGDAIFVDPMRVLFPFDQFTYPWEQAQRVIFTRDGRAERVIEGWIDDGRVSRQEAQEALSNHAGPLWERAIEQAVSDDADLKIDAWDFMSMFSSPHAPLVWASEIIKGTPEEIGPFLPLTRGSKGVAGLMGVQPWWAPHNIEGSIRRSLGLPAFDRWDDYRIDRMIANMVARGDLTVDEGLRAMIEREGPDFDKATRLAEKEFGVQGTLGFLGIPAKIYPEGEQIQRQLKENFDRAWKAYEGGDSGSLSDFFDRYPQYEARLALWKEPEERLQRFLTDQIWDSYNNLADLNRREVREQLGDLFSEKFLSGSDEDIDIDTLGMWLRMMGGDPPGTLQATASVIPLTEPDVAHRIQVFYDTRDRFFNWDALYKIQQRYFMLEKEGRREYLKDNPILENYWDWRRDFMYRNPELAPYLEDDPEKRPKYETAEDIPQVQPFYIWQEWQQVLSPPLQRTLQSGGALSADALELLDDIAVQLGLDTDEMLEMIDAALANAP